MVTFRELAVAAQCPRKLYARRGNDAVPDDPARYRRVRALAWRYPALLANDTALADAPVPITPVQYRSNLGVAKARFPSWPALSAPPDQDVHLEGDECRGRIHKLLPGPSCSLVFPGHPPDEGVWPAQSVRLIAAARALSESRNDAVDRVYAEYPAYGVIREVAVCRWRLGAYRDALRTARSTDGPSTRSANHGNCELSGDPSRYGPRPASASSQL